MPLWFCPITCILYGLCRQAIAIIRPVGSWVKAAKRENIKLPPGDSNYPARWKAIKSNFSCQLSQAGIPVEKRQDGSTLVWQRRYWEHTIRNDEDFNRHIDYIHINPVKHGLVKHVADWPYSTFHRYVAKGIYPPNWCGDVDYVIGGVNDMRPITLR
ncbi:hypothetical protein [Methylomicrobium sp. Wu6]|uniref:REP-associated tyrosine transposase n=1 Tax=Methylomicrobium sp. Wu6 TaxID=3107928 RepID=UPI002DD62206|nr:hypothetical protein [Methylomicrobium sp. Wu6]MEC4748016.1 hypothetical protein [Methylomicrobium sp. Wu6]